MFDDQGEQRRDFATAENVPARLSFAALSKTFGATRALNKVSLDVLAGEIHGLVGQNGSGKSTLIKILAGYYEPDAGSRLSIDGAPVRLPLRPGDYSQFGISFVHQDLALIPSLTVLENLRVSELCLKPRWYISWKEEIRAAKELLEEFALDLVVTEFGVLTTPELLTELHGTAVLVVPPEPPGRPDMLELGNRLTPPPSNGDSPVAPESPLVQGAGLGTPANGAVVLWELPGI